MNGELYDGRTCIFVRSGWIGMPYSLGTFRHAGVNGFWWSSRSLSARYDGFAIPSGCLFHFNVATVDPSSGAHIQYYGSHIRCLRACLINAFRQMGVTNCGRFAPNEGGAAATAPPSSALS